jgi:succinate dehydrogenase/fumarate reductase cytochrome b subunit
MFSGLVGIVVLIADIWAILQVLQSRESTGTKVLWVALIVLLPVLGLIVWYFAGPRGQSG